MEIGCLLRKSLPFPGELQNLVQIGRVEEEGRRADAFVHPPDGLRRVPRVEEETLGISLAEDVVDHLLV